MDLRVSVVLLFFFLSGGNSLKCYKCDPDSKGNCDGKEETCPDGVSKCGKSVLEPKDGSNKVTHTSKGCAAQCEPGPQQTELGKATLHCCDTDLCNAADGVFKGSFLLLFSPLLFYFLFQ